MFCCHKYMNPKAKPGESYSPTYIEQIANIMTHMSLIVPSIIATNRMYTNSISSIERCVSIIYGMAIISLFTFSSLFHLMSFMGYSRRTVKMFHYTDRAVIYIFIASSYTPWLILKNFEYKAGFFFLKLVWTFAILGMTYQYIYFERFKNLETFLYVITATVPACAWLFMNEHEGTTEMIVGGLSYAIGVYFFKSDGKIPFAHAIWHLFVLTGAIIHYWSVDRNLIYMR